MKRALSMAGPLAAGVFAAGGVYLVCVLLTFLLGAAFYSVTLGALVAPVITIAIFVYRWTRRRATTSWPLLIAMLVTQLVIAGLAFLDSPSAALMWR